MMDYSIRWNLNLDAKDIRQLDDDTLKKFCQSINHMKDVIKVMGDTLERMPSMIDNGIERIALSELSSRGILHNGENLSDKQKGVLRYIQEYVQAEGRSPSVAEIKRDVRLSSTSVVHWHLTRLQKMGYIYKIPKQARSIKLLIRI